MNYFPINIKATVHLVDVLQWVRRPQRIMSGSSDSQLRSPSSFSAKSE